MDIEVECLQIERAANGVVTLWLNRPHKRNAVSVGLMDRIDAALSDLENDEQVRVIAFRGRDRTFCAGADLSGAVNPTLSEVPMRFQRQMSGLYDRIYALKKPTVAAVKGAATAGGFELMLACDFAIATLDARIGDCHMQRGLFAGAGPLHRLPRIIGLRRSKELMMTGKLISGEKCADWGLVNDAVPTAEFDAAVDALCAELAGKSPFCMAMTKAAINRGLDADTASLSVLEMMTVNLVNQSHDAREGVQAFVDKRQPVWLGR